MTPAVLSSSRLSHFLVHLISLDGIHQFQLNFTSNIIIIQVKFGKGVIRKNFAHLWPFFDLDLG